MRTAAPPFDTTMSALWETPDFTTAHNTLAVHSLLTPHNVFLCVPYAAHGKALPFFHGEIHAMSPAHVFPWLLSIPDIDAVVTDDDARSAVGSIPASFVHKDLLTAPDLTFYVLQYVGLHPKAVHLLSVFLSDIRGLPEVAPWGGARVIGTHTPGWSMSQFPGWTPPQVPNLSLFGSNRIIIAPHPRAAAGVGGVTEPGVVVVTLGGGGGGTSGDFLKPRDDGRCPFGYRFGTVFEAQDPALEALEADLSYYKLSVITTLSSGHAGFRVGDVVVCTHNPQGVVGIVTDITPPPEYGAVPQPTIDSDPDSLPHTLGCVRVCVNPGTYVDVRPITVVRRPYRTCRSESYFWFIVLPLRRVETLDLETCTFMLEAHPGIVQFRVVSRGWKPRIRAPPSVVHVEYKGKEGEDAETLLNMCNVLLSSPPPPPPTPTTQQLPRTGTATPPVRKRPRMVDMA